MENNYYRKLKFTCVSALKFYGIGIDWLQACLIFGELVKGKGLKVKGLQEFG